MISQLDLHILQLTSLQDLYIVLGKHGKGVLALKKNGD